MFPTPHPRINGARILRLIRDGDGHNIPELYEALFPEWPDEVSDYRPRIRMRDERRRYERMIEHVLYDLRLAGLIEDVKGKLRPTELIEKVQTALDINLTELENVGPQSLTLNPIFGRPEEGALRSDIFVLMPFSNDLLPVYEDHIRKIGNKLKLSVNRADDFFAATSIMSDIWQAIYNTQIVVADCTTRNPNVFYEIGLAHTVGRPAILICQSINDVPFDLRHLRCIIYEYTPRGMKYFDGRHF